METGSNIKKIASIFFWLNVIAFIAASFFFAKVIYDKIWDFDGVMAAIGAFLGITALGVFVGWIGKTLISGFGELVENVEIIRKNTEKKVTSSPAEKVTPPPSVMKTYHPEEKKVITPPSVMNPSPAEEKNNQDAKAVCPIPKANGRVCCPKCGEEQRSGRHICQKCGIPFLSE